MLHFQGWRHKCRVTFCKVTFARLLILFSGVCVTGYSASPLYDENVSITKTGSPTTYSEVGDVIEYTYVVQISEVLTGDSTYVYNISVYDDLVSNIDCRPETSLSFISFSESMTCTGSYTITEEDIEAGEVTNNASVSGSYKQDSGGCCGCGEETITVSASDDFTVSYMPPFMPELSLEKTGSPSTFTEAGEEISYTYTVTNTGEVPFDGPVTVSDNRVSVSCPSGNLDIGASLECSASYTITEEDLANGVVRNTATASANGTSSNEDSFEVRFNGNPELSLQKTASPGSHTNAGELVIYDFTLTNTGNVVLTNPFSINDPLIDEFRCTFPSTLDISGSFQCNGYYRVRTGDVGNTISNCATASANYNEKTISSAEACADSYYQPPPPPPPEPPKPLGPCDIDPNSFECFCEMYPDDLDCTEGSPN